MKRLSIIFLFLISFTSAFAQHGGYAGIGAAANGAYSKGDLTADSSITYPLYPDTPSAGRSRREGSIIREYSTGDTLVWQFTNGKWIQGIGSLNYIKYDFVQKTNFYTVAKDGKGAHQAGSWFYLINGWNQSRVPTTDSFIHFSSDLVTWDTCHAPWRKCHAFGLGMKYGVKDTLVKFCGDLNDYATYDMSAWLAYPLSNGKLGFVKTRDSIPIPPRILFGSTTTANGYTYMIGGQASTTNGATLYGDVYRSNDGFRTAPELVLTDSRLQGNKYGCVVARGNDVYIISGGVYYPTRTYTTSVYKISAGSSTLTTVGTIPITYGVQYPTSFLDTATNNIVFAFGNNGTNGGNQNFILMLDENEDWFKVFSDTIPARHAAAGGLFNGKWVFAGGQMDSADVWQSNFSQAKNTTADNIHLGSMKYGDNSDIVVTAQQNPDGSANIAIGRGATLYPKLGSDNNFTGTNQFSDVGLNEVAIYPATALTGVAKISNYTSEPILLGFNPTGFAWKNTKSDWGWLLNNAPTAGNGYGARIQSVPETASDYILGLTSGSGNGTFKHSWRGDGSHYANTRFPYASGGFQISGYNIGSNREEYITSVPVSLGGTGLNSLGTAGQYLTVNAGATGLQYSTLSVAWSELTGKPTTTTAAGYTDISTSNVNNSVARRDASGYLAATHFITKDTTTYQVNVGGILVRKVAEEYVYTDGPQPVNRFLLPLTETSSASVTLPTTNALYVLTGTSPTATLPAKSFGRQLRIIIKNGGSTDITLTTVAGTSILWYNSAVTSYTITAGKTVEIIEGATYYYIMAFN